MLIRFMHLPFRTNLVPSEAPSEISAVGWNQTVLKVSWREPSPASLNGPFKSFRIHFQRVRRYVLYILYILVCTPNIVTILILIILGQDFIGMMFLQLEWILT